MDTVKNVLSEQVAESWDTSDTCREIGELRDGIKKANETMESLVNCSFPNEEKII